MCERRATEVEARAEGLVLLQRGTAAFTGLQWPSVVNKQRQVPESLDVADLRETGVRVRYQIPKAPGPLSPLLPLNSDFSEGNSALPPTTTCHLRLKAFPV